MKNNPQGPTNPRGGWGSSHVTAIDIHRRQGLSGRPGPPKQSHTSEEIHISPRLSETDMLFCEKKHTQKPANPPRSAHWALWTLGKYPVGLGRPGGGFKPDFRNPTRLRARA